MFHVEHFALRTDVPRGTLSQSLRLTGLPLQSAHANFFPQILSSTRIGTCSGATSASTGTMNVCSISNLAEECGVGNAVGVDQPRRHRRNSNLDIFSVLDSHRRLWSFRSSLPQKS